jgi:hypothetical protein
MRNQENTALLLGRVHHDFALYAAMQGAMIREHSPRVADLHGETPSGIEHSRIEAAIIGHDPVQ